MQNNDQQEVQTSATEETVKVEEVKKEGSGKGSRLVSLDAFRGLTIALMLLVNNTAVDYATPKQLTHAAWNQGVNIADLVFPWFLFCVGTAIPFASASFRKTGLPVWKYDIKALKRAAMLILLGCIIDSSIAKSPVFDLGVLQLIGLAYLFGAVLYELPVRRRMIVAASLLVGYWPLIKFIPIPNVGSGVFMEQTNIIKHINQTYLARFNLSGLFSVIPTAGLVLIGTVVGDILRSKNIRTLKKAAYLWGFGAILTIVGFIWNLHLPFNKPVWTSSYILYTGGLASIVLGVFYVIIDYRGWKWWAYPLVVFGSNAIVAYVIPVLIKLNFLQEWTVTRAAGAATLQQWYLGKCIAIAGHRVMGGWFYTVSYIAIWWIILWIMYRKKIFLRV